MLWVLTFLVLSVGFHQGSSLDRKEVDDDLLMHDMSKLESSLNLGEQGKVPEDEKETSYWISQALDRVTQRSKLRPNTKIAKNVILFLGDGMGISTQTAARIYQGQLRKENGEENYLFFEALMAYTGLSRTYCVDAQVADSACTSTAYTSGVKASIGTMGLNAKVKLGDCHSSKNESFHTHGILEWAIEAGKSTGVVTTARITHASPGGTYAHVADRDWECDTDRPSNIDCEDIASQLVNRYPGNKVNVLLGGGLSKFTTRAKGGKRNDIDLIKAYEANRKANKEAFQTVYTKQDLLKVNASHTDYVLGLFAPGHLAYELDKSKDSQEPTLSEMTKKAIEILSKNKNGFYLFVEGAKIDMAHHDNKVKKTLHETIEFDNAIKQAFNMVNLEETLIVVTADHSHTFTIAGYSSRGKNILGTSTFDKRDLLGQDKLPYLTLGYNNGPGFRAPDKNGMRHNVYEDQTDNKEYQVPVAIPLQWETHGGEDVAVFSTGPWAHLLVGNFEQNYIPIVMSYAARIGPAKSVPLVSGAPLTGVGTSKTILMSMILLLVCKLMMH